MNSQLLLRHKTIPHPKKKDLIVIRLLILMGSAVMIQFLLWFLNPDHRGHSFLFWLLAVSLGYKMIHTLYEWFYLASMDAPKWKPAQRQWSVDMLTTHVPGEPYDMIVNTLQAMTAVSYPHKTYLCDEGDDPYLKKICEELGVVHVYRGEDKTGAKAGNINHALQHFADGEICIILDPDHVPAPEFIDRLVPYFDDPQVGFVQCIQAYSNYGDSFVARGAAEQTFLFYGPLMMGMHRHGNVQAIGANCCFRRAALDSIGGHAAGLCEDMHTSMHLHAKGCKSIYVPELLSRGRVPVTLAAYYKQQLKWSRGCFDLLFRVYPRLFSKWSWGKRIHYLLTPLYFFYGVIGLIDIGVPIISLVFYQVPLFIEFEDFILRVTPMLLSIMVIRHFSQRYVLDDYERGTYYRGGMLRVGSWWVYLLGFLYAVFGRKVPYVPTPKDETRTNDLRNSFPNLAVASLSMLAIFFGLKQDYTPYSLIMAGFAAMNILILSVISFAGQQHWRDQVARVLAKDPSSSMLKSSLRFRRDYLYRLIRSHYTAIVLILAGFGISYTQLFRPITFEPAKDAYIQKNGSFFLLSPDDETVSHPKSPAERNELNGYLISGWDSTIIATCAAVLKQEDKLPFLYWKLPPMDSLGGCPYAPYIPKSQERILDTLAWLLKSYGKPVILGLEIAQRSGQNKNDGFIYLVEQLKRKGATNVAIAWPYQPGDEAGFPGHEYSDMVLLLPGEISDFDRMALLARPGKHWPPQEGRALPEGNSNRLTFLGHTRWTPMDANAPAAAGDVFKQRSPAIAYAGRQSAPAQCVGYNSSIPGYEWMVDGVPLYIKGVWYNPEQEQADKGWPPTRRQLATDFALIKSMGANTISRDAMTPYDHNIILAAGKADLKILYQFRFDPGIDYLTDTRKTENLKNRILEWVKKHKDASCILAWSLGHDTWQQLGHHFYQPYLSEVRKAYVDFIAQTAQEIKGIDPVRPVVAALGGGIELAGALNDFAAAAPHIDVFALAGYSERELESAGAAMKKQLPNHPYIVYEFGAKTPGFPFQSFERLPDENSFEQARLYASLWTNHIEAHRGRNLGGIAYCWRDRSTTSMIQSGITDFKGRIKPVYHALCQVWGGEHLHFPIRDLAMYGNFYDANMDYYSCRVLSPDNHNPALTYEWYVYGEGYPHRRNKYIQENRESPQVTALSYYWRRYLLRTIHPSKSEKGIRFWINHPDHPHRIYLYVHDNMGNVATFAHPVPPGIP